MLKRHRDLEMEEGEGEKERGRGRGRRGYKGVHPMGRKLKRERGRRRGFP